MLSNEKTILLVDDSSVQRLAVSKILQPIPYYQIIEANNGLKALETLKKEDVDLIILDVNMPIMDGFETLTLIREDTTLSHIPVIMCTSVNTREEIMRIVQKGVADYVLKPIDKDTFLPKVQRVLGTVEEEEDDAMVLTEETESDDMQSMISVSAYSALILDENENFRKIARMILNPYYNIIEAVDEEAAIQLALSKQPQIILLGNLAGTLSVGNILSKLSQIIQQKKTKLFRVFSTAIEAIAERGFKYHGRMIRTLDINLLRARFQQMMVLPNFIISHRKSSIIVTLKNYYPQTSDESSMLLRAIAMALDSDAKTVRLDLSAWSSEPMDIVGSESTDNRKTKPPVNEANMVRIASRYLEEIIKEFKSLGIKVGLIGYTLSEDSSLKALLTDEMVELKEESIDYLTTRIAELRQYCQEQNTEAVTSLGQDLSNFGKENGFQQITILAGMLIRESTNNRWNVVEALIKQLSLEQKEIAKDSAL